MKNILIITVSFLLLSCDFTSSKKKATDNLNLDTISVSLKKKKSINDAVLNLRLNHINIAINTTDVFNKAELQDTIYNDSIAIDWGMDNLWDKKFHIMINDSLINKVVVSQSYRTSLSILDDGAHLDLIDWYHYKSKWKGIKLVNNTFMLKKYTKKQSQFFPKVTINQVLKRVIKVTGNTDNKFTRRVKECKGKIIYPCVISISDVTLKIILYRDNSVLTTKIISIKMPMGC